MDRPSFPRRCFGILNPETRLAMLLLAALALAPTSARASRGLERSPLPEARSVAAVDEQLEQDLATIEPGGGAASAATAPQGVLAEAQELYARLASQAPPVERAVVAQAPSLDTAWPTASSSLLGLALGYRGVPYRWGGASRAGLDCSGLIVRAAADAGKALPHSAALLYRLAEPVADDELRPGDLVFFANTYKPGISHVGIYSEGSRFLQASSAQGEVGLGDLAHPYYRRKYAGAGRLRLGKRVADTAISSLRAMGRAVTAPFRLGPPTP